MFNYLQKPFASNKMSTWIYIQELSGNSSRCVLYDCASRPNYIERVWGLKLNYVVFYLVFYLLLFGILFPHIITSLFSKYYTDKSRKANLVGRLWPAGNSNDVPLAKAESEKPPNVYLTFILQERRAHLFKHFYTDVIKREQVPIYLFFMLHHPPFLLFLSAYKHVQLSP